MYYQPKEFKLSTENKRTLKVIHKARLSGKPIHVFAGRCYRGKVYYTSISPHQIEKMIYEGYLKENKEHWPEITKKGLQAIGAEMEKIELFDGTMKFI